MRGALPLSARVRAIGAGYAAKVAASGVFLAGRDPATLLAEELAGVPGLELEVDREAGEVRARLAGCERRASFRPGHGCVLHHPGQDPPPRPELPPRPARPAPERPWPEGEADPDEAPLPAQARARLAAALDRAFQEPDPRRPRRTRAVVVAWRGRLLAEGYAPGFGPESRLGGWSMTKSVTSALCGRLAAQGRLQRERPIAAPEWAAGDPRAGLSFDTLLRMSSGLRFWEQYWNPFSHVAGMLFAERSVAAYAASFPLVAAPDRRWSYASGTTNLIARALREVIGASDYLAYPARELFDRIGMTSAQLEVDASGHFVGSSFCYATARDWARFGQLYLQDGVWEGERLLPEGWVEWTRRPTPGAPQGQYGGHFWLNAGPPGRPARRVYPRLPQDLFLARGFEEQSVSIIPSRELVVVRLGQTASSKAWDLQDLLAGVLDALPEPGAG
ncbi:MAG: serine hydrolase domain-containing protein [Planctomycetota bacterium]